MAQNRHNGAFVFGAVMGGAVGAVVALWKTPYSGQELRSRIGLAPDPEGRIAPIRLNRPSKPLGTTAMGLIEHATAPIVGVKLGQTANNSQPGPVVAAPLTGVQEPKAASIPAAPDHTASI